ncbi:MAG: hypothetical protein OSA41_05695 [Erythrobacter sp.]|jgi:hypothetical protein|nr:hypothetical protein [Erythrobacter sp.]|tara:strand:- start:259711 stop:260019 length:309 start_codon:yes stop_codon:yes gene_type:complete
MSAELKAALTLVERRGIAPLKRVTAWQTSADWTAYIARREEVEAQVIAALEPQGARITPQLNGAQIRMCGLTARSTTSLLGALQNWRSQAEANLKGNRHVRP